MVFGERSGICFQSDVHQKRMEYLLVSPRHSVGCCGDKHQGYEHRPRRLRRGVSIPPAVLPNQQPGQRFSGSVQRQRYAPTADHLLYTDHHVTRKRHGRDAEAGIARCIVEQDSPPSGSDGGLSQPLHADGPVERTSLDEPEHRLPVLPDRQSADETPRIGRRRRRLDARRDGG